MVRHPVLQGRRLAAEIHQRLFAALLVKLLEPINTFPAVSHRLAGLADAAELLALQKGGNVRLSRVFYGSCVGSQNVGSKIDFVFRLPYRASLTSRISSLSVSLSLKRFHTPSSIFAVLVSAAF